MRILFCGDRNWFKKSYIREALSWFDPKCDIIIHGAARGADSIAGETALEMGWPEESILAFPAEWNKFGKSAGPVRNRQMLRDGGPDLVLAFHENIGESKGTKDMVEISCKAGIPALVYA